MSEYDRQQAARRDLDALLTELNAITGELNSLAETVSEAVAGRPRTYWDYQLEREDTPDFMKEQAISAREFYPRYAETLRDSVYQLIGTLHALVDAGPGQPPDLAFSAVAQFSALKSTVDDAPEPEHDEFSPSIPRVSESIIQTWAWIKDALKRGEPLLWSLISHLARVKEWSLNGTIGTGLPGMAQTQISVTFG